MRFLRRVVAADTFGGRGFVVIRGLALIGDDDAPSNAMGKFCLAFCVGIDWGLQKGNKRRFVFIIFIDRAY